MSTYLLIPLEDTVVFPNMNITLPIDVGDDERVLLVPTKDGEYAKVGVLADVVEVTRLPRGITAVSLVAQERAVLGAAQTDTDGRLRVSVEEHEEIVPPPVKTRELEQEYRAVMEEKLELRGDDGRVSAFLRSITDPGALADSSGYSPDLSFEQKVQLLEELDIVERLRLALAAQRDALAETQIRRRIRDDVESGAQKQQREYLLRKQMESIRKELGDDDASVVEEYRAKIEEAGMPETVKEQAERELGRLERLGDGNAESSVIRSYLDWLIAVPWSAPERGAARPGARPRGAGRRSRGPRGRQGPDHRVPGRAQAAQGPGGRRGQALRRDPHPDRPSRHREDLDRRVDRPRHRPRVRSDVAGRRPR